MKLNSLSINTVLIVFILLLTIYIFFYKGPEEEFFQYSRIDEINPGFGDKMWKLESANTWDPSSLDTLSQHWTDGSFGNLVSYLEDRNDATAIKNLPV
jgi:hypothetical protein